MRKNYFKSTKSETNLINSTGYIKWIRTKPLKNARFNSSTLSAQDLTKNMCSEYNDNANNFTGYFSVDVDGNEGAAMMDKKLSAGKVESGDVPLVVCADADYGILKVYIDDRNFDNIKEDIAVDE